MHQLPPLLILITSASVSATLAFRHLSGIPLAGLEKRQTACASVPAGEVCCSNGKYCPAGSYCTNVGCCPDGMPLVDCYATESLSVIPPPAATEPTSPAPASVHSSSALAETFSYDSATTTTTDDTTAMTEYTSEATYTDTATLTGSPVGPTTTAATTAATTATESEYSTTKSTETGTVEPTSLNNTTPSSNLTATISPPPQVTVNAGSALDVAPLFFGLGGFGLLLVFLR
ncbi:hypothetical protein GJ744_007421 [Endocarpon pusillum]|uniref:GPI anchored serine-threonine rich protein n=1 Tax=Endocarpon pusillum TaxID=364733 RepID=A0A8H7AIV3_9EURO|nr:hypothetical protein GJ744_007421 [Endocarpon pusillum]